jgi:hypothetical protein
MKKESQTNTMKRSRWYKTRIRSVIEHNNQARFCFAILNLMILLLQIASGARAQTDSSASVSSL